MQERDPECTKDDPVTGHVYEIYSRNLMFAVYLGDGLFRGIREKLGSRRLDVELLGATVTRVVRDVGEIDINASDTQVFVALEEIERRVTESTTDAT